MRILLISYGMDQTYVDLAKALSTRCDLHLIASAEHEREGYSEIFDLLKKEEISIHYVGSKSSPLTHLSLLRKIREVGPEVIHLPGGKPRGLQLLYPFFRRTAPLIVTMQEVTTPIYSSLAAVLKMKLRVALSLRYADCIIVTGYGTKRAVEMAGFPEGRTFCVPLSTFKAFLRWADQKIGEEENTVLFHGHILPDKGLEHLVRASLHVSEELENFKVIIAGAGDMGGCRKIIEHHPQIFEVHNYFLPYEKVAEVFMRASLVILPYRPRYTAKSGVLSVAYAFSKPVVVTKSGDLPEVVDHESTGLLVPPDNVEALAESVVRLLEDDDLKEKMRRNIRRKVKDELSPDRIAESTLKVYERALQFR